MKIYWCIIYKTKIALITGKRSFKFGWVKQFKGFCFKINPSRNLNLLKLNIQTDYVLQKLSLVFLFMTNNCDISIMKYKTWLQFDFKQIHIALNISNILTNPALKCKTLGKAESPTGHVFRPTSDVSENRAMHTCLLTYKILPV